MKCYIATFFGSLVSLLILFFLLVRVLVYINYNVLAIPELYDTLLVYLIIGTSIAGSTLIPLFCTKYAANKKNVWLWWGLAIVAFFVMVLAEMIPLQSQNHYDEAVYLRDMEEFRGN